MVRFALERADGFSNKAKIGKSSNKLGRSCMLAGELSGAYGFGRRELFSAIRYFLLKLGDDEWLHLEEEYSKTGQKR